MAQVTIEYDGRDVTVKKFLDALLSLKSVKIRAENSKGIVIKTKDLPECDFDDLNESSKKAFQDADNGNTHKSKDTKDLFQQLGI